MTKAFFILILLCILLILSLIFTIKRCNKLSQQNKELSDANKRLENYNKTIEAKLAALHDGDPVDNAIDVLCNSQA